MIKYKKGDLVYVKSATFSCGYNMDKYIGTVVEIENVRDGGKTLQLKGYYWGYKDVCYPEVLEPQPEIFHFDESTLDL